MGFYDYAIEDAALKTADSAFSKLENDYPVFVRRSCQVTAHEFLRVFFTGEYRNSILSYAGAGKGSRVPNPVLGTAIKHTASRNGLLVVSSTHICSSRSQ